MAEIKELRDCLGAIAWLSHYMEMDAMACDMYAVNLRYNAIKPKIERMRKIIEESDIDMQTLQKQVQGRR